MTPASFPQANRNLTAPAGMTREECGDLPTYTDGRHCISLWALSWRERLRVLFTGRVWLWVWSGQTQPPVALGVDEPFVLHDKPRKAAAIVALLALSVAAACGGNPRPQPPAPAPPASPEPLVAIGHVEEEPTVGERLGSWLCQRLELPQAEAERLHFSVHRLDVRGGCEGFTPPRPPRPPRPDTSEEPAPIPPEVPADPDSLTVICHIKEDGQEQTKRIPEGAPDRFGSARWHIDQHKRDYRDRCRGDRREP